MRTLLFLFLVGMPVQAEWSRQVFSGKGSHTDVPEPHTLAYFTKDPFLRDDGNDFCSSCDAADKATTHSRHKVRTEVRPVGEVGGVPVIDLFHYFDGRNELAWKVILAKTGPDEYREIFHVQAINMGWLLTGTTIQTVGAEKLLNVRFSLGGNKGLEAGSYIWLDSGGAGEVDFFGEFYRAGAKVLPPNKQFFFANHSIDFERMTAGLPLRSELSPLCCPDDYVAIRFALRRNVVVVTEARYVPAPKR